MAVHTSDQTPRKPPQAANNIMALLLRSPLHGLLSNAIMLLTFTGRKSGKTYTIPVGYVREGNEIKIFTDHSWWKNLRDQAPVTMRVQGKTLKGLAEAVVDNQEETTAELLKFVQRNPRAAGAYSVTLDAAKQPDPESVRKAAQRFTFIGIRLI